MEILETQIMMLMEKIESMSHAIERLNSKFSLLESQPGSSHLRAEETHLPERGSSNHSYTHELSDLPIWDHKDVLVDDDYDNRREISESRSDAYLSPELQVQRLTAQLTAAYNRIAALEEQLLSKRIQF
ncbi:MAG: hypothetical protein J7545_14675 [Roseofilum sp. SBFL]|uniref:hypothetical protein n=1 Tax=unclassified Roseofilum TaxID=2620099 RepID=UPI001B02C68C|nr:MULTISPECIES: hypothetical protein [unclassified Roseofilum]MBP0013136.1 hypothetical protein [Roseofilum sp. SID3]MBP0026446.1 hypothetical protein [Roseofilum sp. SID2]MBP0037824.1 hypothetical protein [Roseofilum sp. SID1]MBP0043193.1 hypothetical protein [Roseofilum sp. SBFL]